MDSQQIKRLLNQGEGTQIEFKSAHFGIPKTLFDSICGFLNRNGGHILLGVKDNGTVVGVLEASVQEIIDQIISTANNSQKLNPPFYLSPQVIDITDKKVIYIFVPQSSQVHTSNGQIYDRNEDGDFKITQQQARITQLYLRKQQTYTENKIYTYLQLSDLKQRLFQRVRKLAANNTPGHPWLEMNNMELMRSAGLYIKDFQTGKEGFTLAAALLFGKEETILNILPFHKTDAILRVNNMHRYDDRDDVRTNLIESYDRLFAFIRKHLPDRFAHEGTQRVSVRDKIFHEVIGNSLIHREYTNAFPAKLIIEKEKVMIENWNRPHGIGLINPNAFSPFPKNPIIAKFFRTIGRADELGSGVLNTFKYTTIYTTGAIPVFEEGDIFKTIIPISNDPVNPESDPVNLEIIKILTTKEKHNYSKKVIQRFFSIVKLIQKETLLNRKRIAIQLGVSETTARRHLQVLSKVNIVKFKGVPKTGHYELTPYFRNLIQGK
ncbi:MAG: RNA-binding domain-containing protein [Saprospiraceae bacterium]